ncbi:MAG: hypothetical protein U0441_35855 [Polyangiaceae bacterium]
MRSWLAFATCATLLAGCARAELSETLDAGVDAPTDAPDDADSGAVITTKASKLDLLFVVDNSRNVEVPQDLFAKTIPYLFGRLTSPACVNGLGNVVAVTDNPDDPCPVGVREFSPRQDIHIGVISTSLGGHGADVCSENSPTYNPIMNDRGHLISRDNAGGTVGTYANEGFLAWDPSQSMTPPGETDADSVIAKLNTMVHGVGLGGCGFESPLESMYRFLVDPLPYQSIPILGGKATPQGTDEVVLQQRKDFLRPDSAVVVILVTDENDCSIREGGQFFLAAQGIGSNGNPYHLPRGRSECQKDPNDVCCASCGQTPAAGCPPNETDPSCALGPNDSTTDPINLRCFDEKRRFGIDFLYPPDRYVRGFTDTTITDRNGDVTANPLFVGGRSSDLVLFTAITGVPWQDLALDPKDLSKGYKQPQQIEWSLILGDPATQTPPADPLMIESIAPRTGTNPVTGAPLAPPESSPGTNPINGHERTIPFSDDLQYACIYPRPTYKACNAQTPDCECKAPDNVTNPMCQSPDGSYTNIQRYAKGLPGHRQLTVVRDLGQRGVAASICAAATTDETQATFAYRPAVDSLLRALRTRVAAEADGP